MILCAILKRESYHMVNFKKNQNFFWSKNVASMHFPWINLNNDSPFNILNLNCHKFTLLNECSPHLFLFSLISLYHNSYFFDVFFYMHNLMLQTDNVLCYTKHEFLWIKWLICVFMHSIFMQVKRTKIPVRKLKPPASLTNGLWPMTAPMVTSQSA